MTVTVFTSHAAGTAIRSNDPSYAKARAGTGAQLTVYATSIDNCPIGQRYDVGSGTGYTCYMTLLQWNTASLPDDAAISGAVLALRRNTDLTTQDFIAEARALDWGGTAEPGDYVAGANLGSYPLLASYNTADLPGTDDYVDFTSEAAFAATINRSGYTRLLITSNRIRGNNTPVGEERWHPYSEDKGAGYEPKLTVTWTAAAGGRLMTPNRGIW